MFKRSNFKRKYGGPSQTNSKRTRYPARPMAMVRLRRTPRSSSTETKWVDLNGDVAFDNTAASNGQMLTLNRVAQGVAGYQRIGRKITMKSLQLTYCIQNAVLPAVYDRLRVILVKDKSPEGVLPNFSTIFSSVSREGVITSDVESFVNPEQRERFQVLYSKLHTVGSVTSDGIILRENMSGVDLNGKFYKRLNMTADYRGVGSGTADIQANAIYIIAMSYHTNNSLTPNTWSLHFSTRIAYTE